jgi:hypothetical protein
MDVLPRPDLLISAVHKSYTAILAKDTVMTDKNRFGFLICLLLIIGVFIAGCSSESPSTSTVTPVVTTPSQAQFAAGDIIAKTASGGESQLYVIIKYDPVKDEYERAWISKNNDGSWGHFISNKTDRSARKIVEKVYPVSVAHVTVSSIPVVTPTIATVVPTTLAGDAPSVTAISPKSGATDSTVTVTISGTNFQTGAVPKLVSPGYAPVTGSAVSVSSTSITCTFVLTGLDKGSANIVVMNPDGRSDILPNAFMIGEAGPVITGITPNSAEINATEMTYTLYGSNFQSGIKVSFIKGSTEIVCINPVYSDTTKVTCGPIAFSKKNSGTFGLWDVKIVNIDGGLSGTYSQKFTVKNDTTIS